MAALALLACLFAACHDRDARAPDDDPPQAGDFTPPTAAIDVADGELGRTQSLVVRFDEPIARSSLVLEGDLAAEALLSWSSTVADDDTLTLSPGGGRWSAGDVRRLRIEAMDRWGNAMQALQAQYEVKLRFAGFQPAETVLGQADFLGVRSNGGGPVGAGTMSYPHGSAGASPQGVLFVPDTFNHRVLVYGSPPPSAGARADHALGQTDLSRRSSGLARDKFNSPRSVSLGNGMMVLVDTGNYRVLLYRTTPVDAGAVPDVVLGQADFVSRDNGCRPNRLREPQGAAITPDGKILVADTSNNRVLVWNSPPQANGQPPDIVLGQAHASTCAPNDAIGDGRATAAPAAHTLRSPTGVWSDGRRVAVTDSGNHRVLVWNTFPAANFAAADLVLGQGGFSGSAANDDDEDGQSDTPSARTMQSPEGAPASNGDQFAVADRLNHRVLVWNTFPTQNFQPADAILGQGSPGNTAANDQDQNGRTEASASAQVLHSPTGLSFDGERLLVSDTYNHRVLIFRAP